MSTTPSQLTTKTATSVPNAILSKVRDYSPEELAKQAVRRRAIEAVIWGMPAANSELMVQAAREAKGDFNQVVYWSRPAGWKNQTLTPNPDTIYLMPFYDTKDVGRIVGQKAPFKLREI
jgi:hypothetical protein